MLVLSRKKDESIIINDHIRVTVVEIRGRQGPTGHRCPEGRHVSIVAKSTKRSRTSSRPLDEESAPSRLAPRTDDGVDRQSERIGRAGLTPARFASRRSCDPHAPSLSLQQLDELPHPGTVVGPSSDRDERSVDHDVAVDEFRARGRGCRVRGPGSRSSSLPLAPPAAMTRSGPWQLAAIGLPVSTKCRVIATAFGLFRRYSGARPPGSTSAS